MIAEKPEINFSLMDDATEPSAAAAQPAQTPRERLTQLGVKQLGTAETFAQQIFTLGQRAPLLAEFTQADIQLLTRYMEVFHAPAGCCFIEEGAMDDYMVLIISGSVEVAKRDNWGQRSRIAVVTPVQTLGEMSMVDGEPRFASCVALEACQFGVMSRDSLMRLVREQPALGAQLLLKLVQLLSGRLRQTSSKLMAYMAQDKR